MTRLDPESDTGRAGVAGHGQPVWSPDGSAVVFQSATGIDRVDVTTGKRERLLDVPAWAIGVAAGRLLWVESDGWDQSGALFSIEIQEDGRVRDGSPTLIAEEVNAFSVSEEATLVLASTPHPPLVSVWVDRAGNQAEIPTAPVLVWPSISPDGSRITGHTADQIHVYDIERETTISLMPDSEIESGASWSADGQQISFLKILDGKPIPHRIAADGSGEPIALAFSEENGHLYGQSTDGKVKAFLKVREGFELEFRFVGENGESVHPPLRIGDDGRGELSPDGRRFAYNAGKGAETDVYVMDLGSGGRWKVGPGRLPRWSRDGTELFYRLGQALLAVPMTIEGPGRIETLFWIPSPITRGDARYAAHPDGERFFMQRLVSEGDAAAAGNRLTVMLNWMEPDSERR